MWRSRINDPRRIHRFDGDALYLASIKEMGLVLDFMKIHPMATLLGGEGLGLTSSVRMSDEMSIAMHGYFTNEDTLDIDAYNRKWKEALTKVS